MAIRYIVNEKDRIVVATLNDCAFDGLNTANSWLGCDCMKNTNTFANFRQKYLMPNKFTGIAKCSVNDEWNEETGKQIARDRLLNKYHNSLNKVLQKINADILEDANNFNSRVAKKVAHIK